MTDSETGIGPRVLYGVVAPLLAIDVALLVPAPLRGVVERLNRSLRPPPDGFHFDKTHLPHITLTQLFVSSRRIDALRAVIGSIADAAAALALDIGELSHGRTTTALRVAPTMPLSALHDALMERVHAFETGPPGGDAFDAEGVRARPEDVTWVERYRMDASAERFDPHITLGVGHLTETIPPTPFVASTLMLCHLGRFCTCRRVLAEWTLTAER